METNDRFIAALKAAKVNAELQRQSALKWRAEAERIEAELAVARKRGAAAAGEVQRLTAELEGARATIAELIAEQEPPVVVEPPKVEPPVVDPPVVDPPVVVEPPKPQPGAPWTHAYRGCTADEAKAAIPPGYESARANRGGQRTERGFFSLDVGKDVVIEDVLYTGTSKNYQASVISTFKTTPLGPAGSLTLRNVGLDVLEDPDNDYENFKFFGRFYNLRFFKMEACTFEGKDLGGKTRPVEHIAYANVTESSSFVGCLFRNIGGRGPYIAHRSQAYAQYGPDNLPYKVAGRHEMRSCRLIDTERNAERGGFMDSVFDGGTAEMPGMVLRENNVIAAAWDFERSQGSNTRWPVGSDKTPQPVRSCGAFVHNAYQHQGDHSLSLYRRANELIHLTQGNHPIGAIRNAKRVELSGLCVEAIDHRQPYIDIGSQPGALQGAQKYSETVVVENCVSATGTQVRVWAEDGSHTLMSLDCPGKRLTFERGLGVFEESL